MAAPEYYGTVAQVLSEVSVSYDTVDLHSTTELEEWVEDRLRDATDFINRDRKRDYRAEEDAGGEPVPRGIHAIAVGAVCNLIGVIQQRRSNPIVRIDEFQIERPSDAMWTPALRQELRRYPAKFVGRFSTVNKATKEAMDKAQEA